MLAHERTCPMYSPFFHFLPHLCCSSAPLPPRFGLFKIDFLIAQDSVWKAILKAKCWNCLIFLELWGASPVER